MTAGSLADVNATAHDEVVPELPPRVVDKPQPVAQQDSTGADATETTTDDDAASASNNNDHGNKPTMETATAVLLTPEEQRALLAQARAHDRADQVLAAARLLRQLPPWTPAATASWSAEDRHWMQHVLDKAELLQQVIHDLLSDPEQQRTTAETNGDEEEPMEWQKLGHTRGDIALYYCWIVDPETQHRSLKCRIESPIESSLLVPLLATLIETQLFTTWLPTWNIPKVGLVGVDKLAQLGRTEQIIHFLTQVPWPLTPKDAVLQTLGCDDIHDIDDNNNNANDRHQRTTGTIAIKLRSVDETKVDVPIPPPATESSRAYFDGGLLIRKCPDDHAFAQLRAQRGRSDNDRDDDNAKEHILLVGFSMLIDARIPPMFPAAILNFILQTCITTMWGKFLAVAQEIKEGKRPQHAAAIESKREEIYDWVEQRIEAMFQHLSTEHNQHQQPDNSGQGSSNNQGDDQDEDFFDCGSRDE